MIQANSALSLERGSAEYKKLIDFARVSGPRNPKLSPLLEKECEELGQLEKQDLVACWQLQFLREKLLWKYANKLADYYLAIGKKSLALMCLVDSLRTHPDQPEIFQLATLLETFADPAFPKKLPPENCTVSVIMPTFNRHEEIRESIESVLGQTIKDYELIIINDGGTDEVTEVIRSFNSKKIQYHKLHENRGLAGALNEGIARAEGKYIAYLDDDDIYYPNHLETLVNVLDNNPNIDCVYSNAWRVFGTYKNGRFIEQSRQLHGNRPITYDKDRLFKSNYISTLNILYRKRCIAEVGLFNQDLPKMMDWEHLLRLAYKHQFHQINEVTGEYRWKENNMSHEQLEMFFLSSLIHHYYLHRYFDVLRLEMAAVRQDHEHIARLLVNIKNNFHAYSNRASVIEKLFNISQLIQSEDRELTRRLTRSYSQHDPLSCTRCLINRKSWKALATMAPFLVLSILKRMTRRLIQ